MKQHLKGFEMSYDEAGNLEVLVADGTWSSDNDYCFYWIELATDKRIIQFAKSEEFKNRDINAAREFFKKEFDLSINFGDIELCEDNEDEYFNIDLSGWAFFDCTIKKVSRGTTFCIIPIDGIESLFTFKAEELFTA